MQLPRASTSALTDGYCPAMVAGSLAGVSAVDAVACCAVVCRAGNPAAMKSEMPIAAMKGRALPIALPPPFRPSRLLIAELGQSGKVYTLPGMPTGVVTSRRFIREARRRGIAAPPEA